MQVYVGRRSSPQPKKVKRSEISFLDRPTKILGQSGLAHWVGWVTKCSTGVLSPQPRPPPWRWRRLLVDLQIRAPPLPSSAVDLLRAPALRSSPTRREAPLAALTIPGPSRCWCQSHAGGDPCW
jgi:hypothetical protein